MQSRRPNTTNGWKADLEARAEARHHELRVRCFYPLLRRLILALDLQPCEVRQSNCKFVAYMPCPHSTGAGAT